MQGRVLIFNFNLNLNLVLVLVLGGGCLFLCRSAVVFAESLGAVGKFSHGQNAEKGE